MQKTRMGADKRQGMPCFSVRRGESVDTLDA